ncbi:MAG: GNAT family N-acetyltransferase [Phycisphaerales bacterium]|nr:GNAT family N-acetyltransferase [Phycisphaerales bacterium]
MTRPEQDASSDTHGVPAVSIRLARPDDQDAVQQLFHSSALPDATPDHSDDPGEDLFDLRRHYEVDALADVVGGASLGLPSADHPAVLWVAVHAQDGVVGMVGLRHISEDVVEMRRLRVNAVHRGQGIGTALVKHAVRVCAERLYLKVILDTFVERDSAIRLFERAGFVLARSRPSENGRHARLDFYLDLYREQPGP